MKKYSFRLQPVLEMREKVLDEKRREMALVVARINEENEKLQAYRQKAESTKNTLEEIYESGNELNILEITNYKDFFGNVLVAAQNQLSIIAQFEKVLKAKQAEVTLALKEVKVLEKLKETQEKKFYQEYEYLQNKEIDDITSTRYKRVS